MRSGHISLTVDKGNEAKAHAVKRLVTIGWLYRIHTNHPAIAAMHARDNFDH